MRKTGYASLLLLIVLMMSWMSISYAQSGATYYVSPNGRGDTMTLSELNSIDLRPGDTVLFDRGGIYAGSLDLRNVAGTAAAPITVGAYGSGDAPVISGLTAVTNWRQTSANIWSATCGACSDTMLNMVLLDGEIQPLARYPNLDDPNADEGYLYWNSFSGKTQITDSALQTPSQVDWTGGELVARTRLWILDRRPITDHTNRTLTVTFPPAPYAGYVPGDSDYDYRAGYGYFIQNHPAALDQHGEWTYSNNTITLYHTSNPNNHAVMATAQEKVVFLNGANHVTMQNIDIVGGNMANIEATDANHLTFDGVDLYNAGNVAADISRATNVEYRNSEISDALNFGLKTRKCNDCSLHHNHIHDIALIAGMGQGRDGQYNGAQAYGNNITFESNIVERVGYLGVQGRGQFEIRNNTVSDFNRVKTDGSGIYAHSRNDADNGTNVIANNVVYNGIGSVAGTDRDKTGVHGIYLDDGVENVRVTGNTLFNLGENGIKLHNTTDITIEDNTVVDAHVAAVRYADDTNFTYNVNQTTLQNNTFVAVDENSVIIEANSDNGTAGFRNFGNINNNQYCYNGTFMRQLYAGTPHSLSNWRAYNHDENTTTCTTTNKVRNGTFSGNSYHWFGYHRDNLVLTVDNGELKAAGVPGNPVWRHFETTVGEITAGKTYYASFDIRTDQDDAPIDFYLRKHRSPYNKLTDVQTALIGTSSRTIGHIFTAATSELDSSLLVFEVDSSVQTVWVDNVVLYELPDGITLPPSVPTPPTPVPPTPVPPTEEPTRLETPVVETFTFDAQARTVRASWTSVSGTKEYHLRYTDDGSPFKYTSVTHPKRVETVSIGGRSGRICVSVVATYPGRDSLRSANKCVTVPDPVAIEVSEPWIVDTQASWQEANGSSASINIEDGSVTTRQYGTFRSTIRSFSSLQKADSLTLRQIPAWDNWRAISNVGPSGDRDAPVLLSLGNNDYYFLGLGSSDGYHAWHSTDMVNWVERGPVTPPRDSRPTDGRWVTSAEYKDGKAYIYTDSPNDQTPHLFIDGNLDDGVVGTDMGAVFVKDACGSDASIFRDDADQLFHLIYEDWSPINAREHSWDSPLAGHTTSADGQTGFEYNEHLPPVDFRTTATGRIRSYNHPFIGTCSYEEHTAGQDAFGDWTTIKVGGQYYLFGDYDQHGSTIKLARFTSDSIYEQFDLVGSLGDGHPDPTVGFAEGQFYLITQQPTDYVSPGPWVDGVSARLGVDTNGDQTIDQWTSWQSIQERYDHKSGYARVVETTPAQVDLSELPAGYGFQFEFRLDNSIVTNASPVMDSVTMAFTHP